MTPNPNPSPELLPCPFCGGEAEARSTLDVPAYWFGICLSCETMTGYSTCAVGAAMTWNRRNEPKDEGVISDRQINDAIRHGFGDRFANDDQRDRVIAALNNLRANPSIDEVPLVLSEIMAILQPDVLRDRITVLERENRNYAKTMDIIGQLPAALSPPPTITETVTVALPAPGEVEARKLLDDMVLGHPSFRNEHEKIDDEEYITVDRAVEAMVAFATPTLATVAAANDEGERSARMREAIDAGLRAFCSDTSDFTMSSAMRRAAADFIMGQPGMFALATSGSQHEGASS